MRGVERLPHSGAMALIVEVKLRGQSDIEFSIPTILIIGTVHSVIHRYSRPVVYTAAAIPGQHAVNSLTDTLEKAAIKVFAINMSIAGKFMALKNWGRRFAQTIPELNR